MAKPAQFNAPNFSFTAAIHKIDRKKLYGHTEISVTDDKGSPCNFASLTNDGLHILSKKCIGLMTTNSEGNYLSRSDAKAVDKNGQLLELVPSIFEKPVQLEPVSNIEEYLDLNVKAIYQLEITEGRNELLEALEKDQLFHFLFNYRTDYEGDDAFLISNEKAIFMVV